MITFILDDCNSSLYTKAFPIFEEFGFSAELAINTGDFINQIGGLVTPTQLMEMYNSGWGILSHTVTHGDLTLMDRVQIETELKDSKLTLESLGYVVTGFVSPMSRYPRNAVDLLSKNYKFAYTRYTDSANISIDKLVMHSPYQPAYNLNRANMQHKTIGELKAYVDYVAATGGWLVFYEHAFDIDNYTTSATLRELLEYIKLKGVSVVKTQEVADKSYLY